MPTVSCGFTFYICFQPYRILEPSSRPPLEISSPYLLISGHEIHLLVCLSTEEKKKRKAQKFLWTRSPDRLTRGWAMIRHCLTSTQCRTCVHGAGLTAGFGRAPTLHSSAGVRVVQGLGKSLCDGVGKLSCFFCFFFFACAHVWVFWVLERPECWVSVRVDQSLPFCSFPAFGWVSVHSVQAAFMECCWASRWPVPARLWLCWMSVIGR